MHADVQPKFDVAEKIVAFKRSLRPMRDALGRAYAEAKDFVSQAVDAIRADAAAGRPVVPEIGYQQIKDGTVTDATRAWIRKTGCAVVRGVFPPAVASDWFHELGEYLDNNRYEQREVEKRSLDQYFSALKSGKPQIFNVYWSKPQVRARQDQKLAETRAFLNRLWRYEGVFDPDRECTYADRVRRRQPGDKTLGLSPHMDAGTVERWIDPGYQRVYEHVFAGNWRRYDPFDATHRLETQEIPSPAVCSMFRTYQGWTALTRQGPTDGTLRLIPIARVSVRAASRAAGRRGGGRSVWGSARSSAGYQSWLSSALDRRDWFRFPRCSPVTPCSGTRTSAMPSATSMRVRNTRA